MSPSLYANGPAAANTRRALWATAALDAFGRETGQRYVTPGELDVEPHELVEISGDLVADLLHLARRNDVAPEAITRAGHGHFDEEVAEEEDEGQTP
ncbi:hypothetical protein RCO28_34720 [Streptomyces sp. LHD-70]|uniref:hypothetical protein n=1 Tax=Streptomyces sp. LHD-70 TaxID=3072140 RepID=UPI0028104521|nr:hypothetical protein [Streptomyces sp. LHD-70]MDQ8707588.1 hypothetical protein [Streptomyces sp. LHD-70]